MHGRIATSLVLLALAAHSGNTLKCYMCTSLSNEDCGADMTGTSLQPVECTTSKMIDWQRTIEQHQTLKSIAQFFEVDDTLQTYRSPPQNMACAKMNLFIGYQDVIVRTCQMAKTESVDPCNVMEMRLKTDQLGKVEQCALCLKDACNGTMGLSSEIFYIILSFLSILVAFYHWA